MSHTCICTMSHTPAHGTHAIYTHVNTTAHTNHITHTCSVSHTCTHTASHEPMPSHRYIHYQDKCPHMAHTSHTFAHVISHILTRIKHTCANFCTCGEENAFPERGCCAVDPVCRCSVEVSQTPHGSCTLIPSFTDDRTSAERWLSAPSWWVLGPR